MILPASETPLLRCHAERSKASAVAFRLLFPNFRIGGHTPASKLIALSSSAPRSICPEISSRKPRSQRSTNRSSRRERKKIAQGEAQRNPGIAHDRKPSPGGTSETRPFSCFGRKHRSIPDCGCISVAFPSFRFGGHPTASNSLSRCHPERRSPWRPESKDLRLLFVTSASAVTLHLIVCGATSRKPQMDAARKSKEQSTRPSS